MSVLEDFLNSVFLGQMGNDTWLYLPAVIVRVIILYIYAFFLLRLMGKRENKQLSMFDAVVIVAIGNIIGNPAVQVEIPIIFAMVVLTAFLLLEIGFIHLAQKSKKLESFIESEATLLIEDGRVDPESVKKEKLAPEEIYSLLRLQGIDNLGQIKKAYFEHTGEISIFKKEHPTAGLSILPENDNFPKHYHVKQTVKEASNYFCWKCGEKTEFDMEAKFTPCPRCGGTEWVSPKKPQNITNNKKRNNSD
ncbi:MAG TPA: YetF domain-containing protein [Candidatus Sulfotelmatobacter sp.]|nr:YetF domain-containing protein [Candidatus Sulfotelmatobacter sp.]